MLLLLLAWHSVHISDYTVMAEFEVGTCPASPSTGLEQKVIHPPNYCSDINPQDEFDFIIIGGGPAGLTVARRLAENKKFKVLLIEAGSDAPDPRNSSLLREMRRNPTKHWQFDNKRSAACRNMPAGKCDYKMAKLLGGNSVYHRGIYSRGNREDFDELEQAGNPGWSFKTMLKYFKKLENYDARSPHSGYHSRSGSLPVSDYPHHPHTQHFKEVFLSAAVQSGIPCNTDLNGPNQTGIAQVPGLVEGTTGIKASVVKAYLSKIPKNLKICKNALVTSLVIDADENGGEKGAKEAIVLLTDGKWKYVKFEAKKEYIIAAGVLGTPQLLERSGIGRKEILERADVPVVQELPGVGENLRERYESLGSSFYVELDGKHGKKRFSKAKWKIMGFFNVTDMSQIPEVQILLSRINQQKNGSMWFVALGTSLLHREYTGSVHITQTIPFWPPQLESSQLYYKKEAKMLVEAARFIRNILKHPLMKEFKPRPYRLRECMQFDFNSKEEILCQIQYFAKPKYDLAGTARMGPEDDPDAVVDANLKVRGISNVRVVDLSVLPKNPRGDTLVPTIAVAERAADLIKEEHKVVPSTTPASAKNRVYN